MSPLYKNKDEQKISVEFNWIDEDMVELLFTSDCGKHGTDELLDSYKLTAERLLSILQERTDYTEEELN